jgi:methyl-accepting chemotaxis protein
VEVKGIKLSVPGRRSVGRLSLRTKILLITGLTGALVAGLLIAVFSVQMRSALREDLASRARVVSIQLSTNLAAHTAANSQVSLQQAADATLRDVPDVAYVVVRDSQGEVLALAADKNYPGADKVEAVKSRKPVERELTLAGRRVLEDSAPIFFDSAEDPRQPGASNKVQVGTVQVGIQLGSLVAPVRESIVRSVVIGVVALLLCMVAAALLSRLVTVPLERLAQAAAGIAAGDLRQRVEVRSTDEIGDVALSFGKMAETVTHLVADLRGAAADIEREANSALTTSSQQSAMAHEQASAISETSTTVAEIAQTAKQATSYADSVISGTQRSEALSTEGQKVVAESVAGMEKLGEQVRAIAVAITELNERTLQIGDIITTVRDVAEQSKVAANQVRGLLGEVQKGTKAAVAATDEGSRRAQAAMALAQSAGSAILGLAEVIKESSAAARQIAGNTRQQTIGVEQIATAMSELSVAMADSVNGTRQIEQVAGNLSNLSKKFSELVGRYQL